MADQEWAKRISQLCKLAFEAGQANGCAISLWAQCTLSEMRECKRDLTKAVEDLQALADDVERLCAVAETTKTGGNDVYTLHNPIVEVEETV